MRLLAYLLALVTAIPCQAQYIVTLSPSKAKPIIQSLNQRAAVSTKVLDPQEHIILVDGAIDIAALETMDGVVAIELDADLLPRSTPNDLFYRDQYGLSMINMPEVWSTITDAVDYGGREIVVAVLDDGFQVDHPDLINRIYINEGEIPNNGIDDDQNGLVDDYKGWNIDTNNDNHMKNVHGTSVAGIIGAEGDNGEGMAGVSWNVKILPISGIDRKSEIIEAYGKLRNIRKLYNDSLGRYGAYIVANNYSGGIPGAFANANETWCSQYDNMGEVGILSIGATVNSDSDIDQDGDMPSTCTSPYLIVTTNIDANAVKVRSAGYSLNNVDLGAPGRDIITTTVAGSYHNFSGTSASAPHVAGVASLLFATPCPAFYQLTIDDPAQAALQVREAILSSTSSTSSLLDITTTGGRLNAAGAFSVMQTGCGGSVGPIGIQLGVTQLSTNTLEIRYETPDQSEYQLLLTDITGRTLLRQDLDIPFYEAKRQTISFDPMPAGVYIITIVGKDEVASVRYFHRG